MSATSVAPSSYTQAAYAPQASSSPASMSGPSSSGYSPDAMSDPSGGSSLYNGSSGGGAAAAPAKKKHTMLYAILGTVGVATLIGAAVLAYKKWGGTKPESNTNTPPPDPETQAPAGKEPTDETINTGGNPPGGPPPPGGASTAKEFKTVAEHKAHIEALRKAKPNDPGVGPGGLADAEAARQTAHEELDTAQAALDEHIKARLPLSRKVAEHPLKTDIGESHEDNKTAKGHLLNLQAHDNGHAALEEAVEAKRSTLAETHAEVEQLNNNHNALKEKYNEAVNAHETAVKNLKTFTANKAAKIPVPVKA